MKPLGIGRAVKHARAAEGREYREATAERIWRGARSREKPLSFRRVRPVPETDTGGRGEYPKVLE